jgi:hypothetical protein
MEEKVGLQKFLINDLKLGEDLVQPVPWDSIERNI